MIQLKVDYRYGGNPRYILTDNENELMQVPLEAKKCVVFIGVKTKKGTFWVGTAFFVGVPIGNSYLKDRYFNYLVTAKHCIDGIKSCSIDGNVLIRINLRDGSFQEIPVPIQHWKFHPTEPLSTDVAVLWWPTLSEEILDFLVIPSEQMSLTEQHIKEQEIGEGDEIFITGLFKFHYGTQRNFPIIRTGNIALMPEEKIKVKLSGRKEMIDAYLVEGRSIGGLSGSPVFVNLGLYRKIKGENVKSNTKEHIYYWMGLVHGHFDDKASDIDDAVDKKKRKKSKINVGISMVVPTIKILEVINQEEFMQGRKKEAEKLEEENLPTPDIDLPEISKEDFMKTLEKVSKKVESKKEQS